MGEIKESVREFCSQIISEYPGIFRTNYSILYCLYCDHSVTSSKTSHVKQHIAIKKHQAAVDKKNNFGARQQTLLPDQLQRPQQIEMISMDIRSEVLLMHLIDMYENFVLTFYHIYSFYSSVSFIFFQMQKMIQPQQPNKIAITTVNVTTIIIVFIELELLVVDSAVGGSGVTPVSFSIHPRYG